MTDIWIHTVQNVFVATKEDEQLKEDITAELTTYEQIRKRITKLLESPRAKEINRDVSFL